MPIHSDQAREAERVRSLLQAASRSALEESGQRIRDAQAEIERVYDAIGRQTVSALDAGLTVSEVAAASGLSRAKIYELRDAHRSTQRSLSMRILAQLAGEGGSTVAALGAGLDESEEQLVAKELEDLHQRELVRVGLTEYDEGEARAHWYRITQAGFEHVENWLASGGEAPRQMSVYVGIAQDEKEAIRNVAIDALGSELFAVIEPDITSDPRQGLELGFNVAAEHPDEAAQHAGERIRELRRLAGLPPQPALVTAIVPGPRQGLRSPRSRPDDAEHD